MIIKAQSVEEYFEKVPDAHKPAMNHLRKVILEHLPPGFEEALSNGAPGYVVPHSLYPAGYHVKPEEPLPFITLMSQKHYIGLYHMGIYADDQLKTWFTEEFAKQTHHKLDMGKSCIRLKYMDDIPFELIGELVEKISVDKWIKIYEEARKLATR